MQKNVLITGGAGSIGIHVISHIMHQTDWNVVVLDSFRHKGYRERITRTIKDHPSWADRVRNIQTDLTCPINESIELEIGTVDYVLHLAALSDVFFSYENPVYTIQNNINSTLVMLEYAKRAKPEQFIYFSTDEVYGAVKSGDAHAEWDTHRPSNAYAASKSASEDICYAYWRSYGVPLIITNTMNNFGEMQSSSKFPVIIQKKVNAGEIVTIHGNEKEAGTRFYIHSRNVADALLHIIKQGVRTHQIGEIDDPLRYHIVGDECLSNLELAQTIADLMGKDLKYETVDFHKDNPGHDIHYGLQDNNLRASGWKQPVDFKTSMKETIEWQENNLEWIQ
jgi:dTDP-glucose 4,6-dehydratase